MISVTLTFEVFGLDGLGGVDEPALVGPARQVAEVLPEVGQARRAARQHRLRQVEVLLHVGDLDGPSGFSMLHSVSLRLCYSLSVKEASNHGLIKSAMVPSILCLIVGKNAVVQGYKCG